MALQKFDDWKDVKDCNECESWWLNQCDGTQIGVERPCKAFKAVRRVSIPDEIKSLRSALETVYGVLTIFAIGWLWLLAVVMFG